MIRKIYFPHMFLPLAPTLSGLVDLLISTVVLLVADPGLAPVVAPGALVQMGEALWLRS